MGGGRHGAGVVFDLASAATVRSAGGRAGDPREVRVLGPSRPDGAFQVVDARLLRETLEGAVKERRPLDTVRGLSDDLGRRGRKAGGIYYTP